MSGTTFTWTGLGVFQDWTDPANWQVGATPATAVPSKAADVAIAAIDGPTGFEFPIISGGAVITLGSLSAEGTSHVIVGGSQLGGVGSGSLTALGSISVTSTNPGGGLVGGPGSTITTPSLTVGAGAIIGGGGTFNVANLANAGIIQADGGDFNLGALTVTGGAITGAGSIEVDSIVGNSTLDLGSATAETINVVAEAAQSATVIFENPGSFTGSINLANPNTHLDLFFQGQALTEATFDGTSLIVSGASGTLDTVTLTGNVPAVGPVALGAGLGEVSLGVVCYARGTRIGTPAGSARVEDLAAGDLVLTARGEARPIVWVGRRRVECDRHPEPAKVWPIRIKAGAFGPRLPERDLRVSPQHAIFDEDVLIPAKYLVNGTSVAVEQTDLVEYYHVELPKHDVLLAEGLPTESYLENSDRSSFENGGGVMQLHPDFSTWTWDARSCAELKVVGPEVERVKAKLARNAALLARRAAKRGADTARRRLDS